MKVVKYVLSYELSNRREKDKLYLNEANVVNGSFLDIENAQFFDTKQEALDYNASNKYICQVEEYEFEVEMPETFDIWVHRGSRFTNYFLKLSFDSCKDLADSGNCNNNATYRFYKGGTASVVSNQTGITHYVKIIN